MARQLSTEEHTWRGRGSAGSSVDIDEQWFDGSTWELVQGEDFDGELTNVRSTIQGTFTRRGEPDAAPGYEGKVCVLDTKTNKDEGTIRLRATVLNADSPEGQAKLGKRATMASKLRNGVVVTTTITTNEDDEDNEDD